ncbi:LPS-assembly lipoprotein LptE [Thiomicrorhabdus lithotrophica]|mgnify:FL=1|uniref:LPS assembly lipoprotein LptE n=1 Tax=Thiomicrorhabdus lithotrophica TaxID=2949997 RepID=A0ABY8C9M8_9GAMM|nr:LPS assembly lipoprotein LptE [Thiomicrorhabdus lithotrophica]WEJ62247.1 LPS assembly lipoprotein LptE [Thiomicrorhabdus lithotrophica]
MLKKLGLYSLLFLLVAQLSACGFHLRGMGSVGALTFKSAQIEVSAGVMPDIEAALERQLKYSGVELLDNQTAEVQIKLLATNYTASRTSTSGLGDTTSELLKMTQSFKVIDLVTGQNIVSDSSSVYRDRQINTAAVLSSDSELRSIKKTMTEDLARQILDRVRRAMQANSQPSSQGEVK